MNRFLFDYSVFLDVTFVLHRKTLKTLKIILMTIIWVDCIVERHRFILIGSVLKVNFHNSSNNIELSSE